MISLIFCRAPSDKLLASKDFRKYKRLDFISLLFFISF